MARSVFVTSAEGQAGKSTVALGLLDALVREVREELGVAVRLGAEDCALLFDAAVLMHPLIPFTPQIDGKPTTDVLITAGRADPICPPQLTSRLEAWLRDAGARAVAMDPKLILFDEPTSALDLHHQIFVLDEVRAKAQRDGSLGLVAIHDINLAARMCDQLVVLKSGHIRAQGAPGDVLTCELVESVYGVEADIVEHRGVPVVAPQRVNKQ